MSEELTLDDSTDGDKSDTSEWTVRTLGELAEYQNGNAFSKSEWGDQGYPIIRIQNLTGQKGEFNYFDGDLEERYEVEAGDILLSWSATIDVFQWSGQKAALNQHIFRIDTSSEVNDTFYLFKLQHLLPRLTALSHGSTMQHVRKADLVNIDANIPPLSEQRKIATVLNTIDRAIEKTGEIIDRATRVRKRLHQTLFRDWSGETYTDPLAGKYPADWELKTLSDVVTVTDAEHFTPDYVESGIPVLRPGDLSPGRITLENVEKRVNEETYEELTNRYTPSSRDIVYSRSQNFAVASRVIEDKRFCLGQDMVVIESGELNETFLLHLLNSPVVRNQAVRRSTGSTFSRVNLGDIRSYRIPIPSNEVQQEIAKILAEAEERIRVEKETEGQLSRLKRGLMQDLLSGKIRTTDTNIAVPEEIAQHG